MAWERSKPLGERMGLLGRDEGLLEGYLLVWDDMAPRAGEGLATRVATRRRDARLAIEARGLIKRQWCQECECPSALCGFPQEHPRLEFPPVGYLWILDDEDIYVAE